MVEENNERGRFTMHIYHLVIHELPIYHAQGIRQTQNNYFTAYVCILDHVLVIHHTRFPENLTFNRTALFLTYAKPPLRYLRMLTCMEVEKDKIK
jgi:hypothetical protein